MEPGQPGADITERERRGATPGGAGQPGWPVNPLTGQPVPRPYPASSANGYDARQDVRNGNRYGPAGAGEPPSARSRRPEPEERPPWEDDENSAWEWQLANPSLAGAPLEEMTGTGKFAAVFPLTPGEAVWGKGFSAPKAPRGSRAATAGTAAYPGPGAVPRGVEVDEQPSTRMRALSPGNVARAAVIITIFIFVSRVLGLFRTSLFAAAFGSGFISDVYVRAFVLPDAIFNIVAGGALASAFIPVFTDYLVGKRDKKTAWHVASAALNTSTLLLIVLAVVCIIFAPEIIHVTIPTIWSGSNPEGPYVAMLTRVMLLQPIFLGASTLGVGILQARQRFLLPAIGQAIYTVGPISGILATLLDRHTGIFGGNLGIWGPTWGVVAGAALQFAVLIPGLVSAKMAYRLTFDLLHPGVLETMRLMVPRIINASMNYVAIFVTQSLLGFLSGTGATYGYLTAFTLVQLPLSLFSVAIAQAAFPTMAAFVADSAWDRLRATITSTLRGVIFLAIPASLGMGVLARPLVDVLLAHGRFTTQDISDVAVPLLGFSIGLLGMALTEILTRTFYALHNSRTPVQVNLLFLPIVIGLSVVLLNPLGAGGLALAFALGALGESFVLLVLLSPKVGRLDLRTLGSFTLNVLAASLVMALAALVVYTGMQFALPAAHGATEAAYQIARVGVAIVVAVLVYYGFSRFLGTDSAFPVERVLGRFTRFVRR